MNRFMYWFGIVIAILSIMGGIVGLFIGAGQIAILTVLLGYILMVLLDFADSYINAHK